MDKVDAQSILDECGIDEDVLAVTTYFKGLDRRVEIMTDRVAYDLSEEKLHDIHRLKGTQDVKDYIFRSQI